MISNDPRCLAKGRLRSRAFPIIRQLGSLPAGLGNNLIPQFCRQRTERIGRSSYCILIGIRPSGINDGSSTVITCIAFFRGHLGYTRLGFLLKHPVCILLP
ncbi:hypothetical protein [Mycolicibacterium houstonense]|uniref:hypothetical protein n=1 Tax=Mycolicibacterium houstonense TaxID=146021 RepID=UPI003F96DB05